MEHYFRQQGFKGEALGGGFNTAGGSAQAGTIGWQFDPLNYYREQPSPLPSADHGFRYPGPLLFRQLPPAWVDAWWNVKEWRIDVDAAINSQSWNTSQVIGSGARLERDDGVNDLVREAHDRGELLDTNGVFATAFDWDEEEAYAGTPGDPEDLPYIRGRLNFSASWKFGPDTNYYVPDTGAGYLVPAVVITATLSYQPAALEDFVEVDWETDITAEEDEDFTVFAGDWQRFLRVTKEGSGGGASLSVAIVPETRWDETDW